MQINTQQISRIATAVADHMSDPELDRPCVCIVHIDVLSTGLVRALVEDEVTGEQWHMELFDEGGRWSVANDGFDRVGERPVVAARAPGAKRGPDPSAERPAVAH